MLSKGALGTISSAAASPVSGFSAQFSLHHCFRTG
jgi:hypothetical protein